MTRQPIREHSNASLSLFSLPRSIRPTVGRTQESLTLRYLDDEWVQYYTAEI